MEPFLNTPSGPDLNKASTQAKLFNQSLIPNHLQLALGFHMRNVKSHASHPGPLKGKEENEKHVKCTAQRLAKRLRPNNRTQNAYLALHFTTKLVKTYLQQFLSPGQTLCLTIKKK